MTLPLSNRITASSRTWPDRRRFARPELVRHRNARSEPARPVCLLTTCQGERALSHALIQHLSQELSATNFTLREDRDLDAIWVCGYRAGSAARVAQLRARFPSALLLVTARESTRVWGAEAMRAGADHARAWPVPLGELERLLHGRSRDVY